MYPTTNILLRVCQVESTVGIGTAFTIDVSEDQYLVTAKHVVPDHEPFSLTVRGAQSTLVLEPAHSLPGVPTDVDVAVLPLKKPMSAAYELIPHSGGLMLGQEVLFYGFPYGMAATGPMAEHLALVKHGFVSMLDTNTHPLYLDGFNNPGFSGGPVTFVHQNTKKLHVAGVISGYRFEPLAVLDATGAPEEAARFVQANSGIVVVAPIRYVVEAIERSRHSQPAAPG